MITICNHDSRVIAGNGDHNRLFNRKRVYLSAINDRAEFKETEKDLFFPCYNNMKGC